jgi:hypothetical protein
MTEQRSGEPTGGRTPAEVAARLAERYPPPPRIRRAAVIAAVVVTVLAALAVVTTLTGQPQAIGQVASYEAIDADTTSVTVEVTKPEERAATCTVAVQSVDGRVTGTAAIAVPAGDRVASATVEVTTLQPGVYASVADCRLT